MRGQDKQKKSREREGRRPVKRERERYEGK